MYFHGLSTDGLHVWRWIVLSAAWSWTALANGQAPRSPLDAIAAFSDHIQDTVAFSLAKNGKSVAVGGMDGKILRWSVPEGKLLASVPVDARMIIALAYSPDGRFLAASALAENREQSNFILVVDCQSLKPHVRIALPDQAASSLAWSPDSSLLAVACGFLRTRTGVIRLYQARTGVEQGVLSCEELAGVPKHVQFAPDGTTIAVGGSGGVCDLWDIKERKLRWSVNAHRSIIFGLAFSPSGETLATLSENGLEVNL